MKKTYSPPVLTNYGNVEKLTQANRTNGNPDVVSFGGTVVAQLTGSQDAIVP